MTKKKENRNNTLKKRVISIITAFTLVVASLPMSEISTKFRAINNYFNNSIVAHAYSDVNYDTMYSPRDFIVYSQAYRDHAENHFKDDITIAYNSGNPAEAFEGFLSLGTEDYPFAGSITIEGTVSHDLNIDQPLFDYVYDYVEVKSTDEDRNVVIQPTAGGTDAVFANHVLHDDGSKTGAVYGTGTGQKSAAEWIIEIDKFDSNEYKHGSLIGIMEANAEATVKLINNYRAVVESDENAGAICGTIKSGAKLTVSSITGSDMTSVTGNNGHAGGLVGEMKSGSTLTVSGTSFVSPTATIEAKGENHYAGGLVGYNDRATVTLTNGYTAIKNTVKGVAGAGGLYGYYKPIMTDYAYTLNLDGFTVGDSAKRCTVSCSGGAGGFFGVLDNPGGEITLSGSEGTVYSSATTDGTVYGGIIGTYKASSLDDILSVNGESSTVTLHINTSKNNNNKYYGGVIGEISGAAFVSVADVDVSATNAADEYFGGVVGCVDNGYLYVNGITLSTFGSSNNNLYRGGAIVGHTESGVVHLTGKTDISNAMSGSGANYGQIVGYRDNALVFAESDWDLTRSSTAVYADDIGSWGEVVRFKSTDFTTGSVLETYYDPTDETPVHYATVKAATITSDKITLSSKSTFATAALNMQLNDGSGNDVLKFKNTTDCEYSVLSAKNVVMTANVDLSHTGMTGLTRDNGKNYQYSGSEFDGGNFILTLSIGEGYEGLDADAASSGKGMVYLHRYNGLFGETTSAFTIKNVTIKGTVYTKDRAGKDSPFYVGTVAGNATATFNASKVTVDSTTKITYGTSSDDDELYVGGLVGKMSAPGTSIIGTQTGYTGTSDSTFGADISGNSGNNKATAYIGGVSGYVNGGTVKVYDVSLSGSIADAGTRDTQSIGGLFAGVNGSTLDLNGIEINGLTVKGKMNSDGSMGGLLGYSWDSTTPTFNNIKVVSSTLDSDSTNGNMAGLVYTGSGYWKYNKVEIGAHTNSSDTAGIALSGTAASFGMLVNKAYSGSNAMYLELPSGYTYKIYNVTGSAPTLYDEIAVYTVMPKNSIEANGNSVISINTTGTTRYGTQSDTTVNMTSGSCNTYQNQVTAFNKVNPNSRYYYNVDTNKTASSGAAALYLWSVYQYADTSIQSSISASAPSSSFSGDLDLDGYSYYPVDVSGTVNIQGAVALHNKEIESRESASSGGNDSFARTTLDSTKTQHYLMHAGLFRNVSGTVNVNGALSLGGTIPNINGNSGALIFGTIGGSTSSDAKISSKTGSISLSGIKVHNKDSTYSPLLINKANGYVVMDIYNVSADSTKYSSGDTIATSLIGAVGSDSAEKVQVTFSKIKLDGRTSDNTDESNLTDVYGTSYSLFTKATLLHSLTYSVGSGSFGTYNYEYSEDWSTSHVGKVTYGIEVYSPNSVNKDDKEYFYYKNNGDNNYITNPKKEPTTAGLTSAYVFDKFLPYVYVWGTSIGTSTTKHQLDVNHAAAAFTGCGTYNHPYTIAATDADKSGGLITLSRIISGTSTPSNTYTLSLPDDISTPSRWCNAKGACEVYTFDGSATFQHPTDSTKNKSLTDVRKYLAGAYYSLSNDIELSGTNFGGLGSSSADDYVFRGVIVGNTHTITNKTTAPLIYASNGCVVRGFTIKVQNATSLSVSTNGTFATSGGANAYGAVIGRVFGGDNIIDQVTVDVSDASISAGNIRATIGSYVGVVVNGGVFFRNMDKVTKNVLFSGGVFAENDMAHLYCNPIVGRVINGFAVNETSKYSPYENESGTRTFGSGATVSGNATTLKNGNKNYSITDINPDEATDKLSVSGTAVSVPGSQAFFVMSLIINSGMGSGGTKATNGGYYGANQTTRHAKYTYVGTDTSDEASDVYKDYLKACNDTSTSPYLIEQYTTGSSANTLGSGSSFAVTVSDDIVLPDGYKGIGNVYNSDANLQLALSSFNGNDHSISQNTTFYSYTNNSDNYLPYNTGSEVHGLGLFNYINNASFSNCILKGNVTSRQYNDDGTVLNCTTYNNYRALASGSLIGTLNLENNATITDIYLQDTYTESPRDAAGLIGYLINSGKTVTITNTTNKSTQSKEIRVNAGINAAGIIARQGNAKADISQGAGNITLNFNGHYFDFVSIVSRYNGSFTQNTDDWAFGVGGLVGIARGAGSKITINDVNIGNATKDSVRIVACEYIENGETKQGDIYVGGLVGVANKAPITATNCNIYNVTVRSKNYSGGVLGWGGTQSPVTLNNFTIKTLESIKAKIYSSGNKGKAGCVVGYSKGGDDNNSMGTLILKNSTIEGYSIEGYNAGGVLGDWEANKEFSIKDSVVKDCNIIYTNAGGGIAGNLNKSLFGYNVQISGITFTAKSTAKQGYITGSRGDSSVIKIVGFLRSGTISEPKLVGSATANATTGRYSSTDLYGSGGYVIFADFDETLTNETSSSINHGSNDVDGESPFVTVNPILNIDGIGSLTGDGVSTSAVTNILTDSTNKKYTVCDMTTFLNEGAIKTDTVSSFSAEWGDVITGKDYNFPLLVINDTATAESDVNNYLRMLTNMDSTMDFSYGGTKAQSGNINNNANIGTVTIKSCVYDKTAGTFTISSKNDDASLVITGGEFKIRTDNSNKEQYDTAANNGDGQFTLINVAFKDPSNKDKIAYHLYVPVIVKKLVEYNFDISVNSGTNYDRTQYTGRRGYPLLENLGTPITFEFEYKYLRSATEWAAEDKDYYYEKYLSITSDYGSIDGTNTQLVLVDVNRGGKEYYLSNWTSGLTNGNLDLHIFKDSEGTPFVPLTFQELINTQGITGEQQLVEKYYISVFTKASSTNSMFHYHISSTSLGTSEHPARRVKCEDQLSGDKDHSVVHLIMGNFYTNNLVVATPTADIEEMSKNHKQIVVTLTATVDIVDITTRNRINSYLGDTSTCIYESLLVSFQDYENNIPKKHGVKSIDSWVIAKEKDIDPQSETNNDLYTIKDCNNRNVPITNLQTERTLNYIEFQNNTDISSKLRDGSVTISATVKLNFDSEETRTAQFPYKAQGSPDITGSKVEGYSNISTSPSNTAYSLVSKKVEDQEGHLYFVSTEETADLTYSADYMSSDDRNQLGVNGREIESKTSGNTASTIYTVGRYDATGLINADKIQYVKCKVELLQKDNNGQYQNVAISTYLNNLSVIAGKTPTFSSTSNPNQYEYVFSKSDVAQFQNEPNVYKIPIVFDVITGNKTGFANTLKYANYQVKLTVSAFDTDDSSNSWADANAMNKSSDSDFVIYTNARIYTDLIKQAS
ncbi:MAG: hypothetical protein J5956_10455 [Ruminococcus sp.]|nr:hypothetical protein [Ruminococcus sp.]